jgi:predicted transcriptional regulator
LRINPYTYESEPLVRDNDYEIYSFTVLDDNTIIFNGLRLSDGKIIIANIDNNGQVKVIKETGNTKVTLHRIQ